MNKICCFGELLLRMSPALSGQWLQRAEMPVYIGGAELNVANALALWKLPVKYVTALPMHSLSNEICNALAEKDIDTSPIFYCGERIGIYFLPQGADLKHADVIYDRAQSSFASLKPGMLNWDIILSDVNWLHFSAITPALNSDLASVCAEAVECAAKKNITVSVDLNYRAKLWQYGKKPMLVMPELVKHCDVIMGNIWSANSLLNIQVDEHIHAKKSKEAYLAQATLTAAAIMHQFPKCKTVANTFRFDAQEGISYFASLNDGKQQFFSKEIYIKNVVDKVGTGDCFMAGLIYGYYHKYSLQKTLDYAAAAAVAKMQEPGDSTKQTAESIIKRM